jgi:outer membrane lipoprotein LolB
MRREQARVAQAASGADASRSRETGADDHCGSIGRVSLASLTRPNPNRRAAAGLRAALAVAATAVLLGGCASLAPVPPSAHTGTAPEQLLQGEANIDYHGRFAVHYVDNNGDDRNVYGNFDLQQQAGSSTLQLLNPLGQTMARVRVSAAGATLELPNHPPQNAPAVETLMQRAIGFPLPLAGLQYWLKPQAAPDTPADVSKDPVSGRISQIRQDDWTIDYLAYADAPTGSAAANQTAGEAGAAIKRVNLSRANPALEVKLVLDH